MNEYHLSVNGAQEGQITEDELETLRAGSAVFRFEGFFGVNAAALRKNPTKYLSARRLAVPNGGTDFGARPDADY